MHMTSTQNVAAAALTAALTDIALLPSGADIYCDPNVAGLAWCQDQGDYIASGAVGLELASHEASHALFGEVVAELDALGYTYELDGRTIVGVRRA